MVPFTDNEEEKRIIEKILKKKSTTASFSKIKAPESSKELPPILKNNPHPDYIELWNRSEKLFWKQYWTDKRNGTLKFARRQFTVNKPISSQEQLQ